MKKHIAAAVVTSSVLLVGGVAFAFEGAPSPTTTTVDSSSTDTSTAHDTQSSDLETNDAQSSTDAPDSSDGTHPDNHGAAVSEAAHTCPPGPDHGKCVSAVAHEGKDSTNGTDATDSSDDEATETASDDETTESDTQSSGTDTTNSTTPSRHGKGHGH